MSNRILKESICRSETIDELNLFEEVFFYRLIVNCDDYGRYDAREKILKSSLFPLKDDIGADEINSVLNRLCEIGLIFMYEVDGKRYLQMNTWLKHQQVRNKKSKYPAPEINCNQMISNDINCCSKSKSESNTNTNPNPNPNPNPNSCADVPTFDEVKIYCEGRGNGIDPNEFMDYYNSREWILDRGPVRSWKSLIDCWERRKGFVPESEEEKSETRWQS